MAWECIPNPGTFTCTMTEVPDPPPSALDAYAMLVAQTDGLILPLTAILAIGAMVAGVAVARAGIRYILRALR